MGIPAQHEPPNMQELRRNAEFFTIFEAGGWTEFFQHLNGFHLETTLQFALNITETHLEVRVSEAIGAEVIGLPQVGRSWFVQRTPNAAVVQDFLREGEHIR